jgi:hypothetical protein
MQPVALTTAVPPTLTQVWVIEMDGGFGGYDGLPW